MNSVMGGITRGCGRRVQGGIYSEMGLSPNGKPLEYFVMCPPIVVDKDELGLRPLGVSLIEDAEGVFHIWDWVGSRFYPNVTDFLEEVRRFGMSRKLNPKMDFSKLTSKSRHVLLHNVAHIGNAEAYHADRIGGNKLGREWNICPKDVHKSDHVGMCAGLWWEDVVDIQNMVEDPDPTGGPSRIGIREMPSFRYKAAKPAVKDPNHSLAIFASFPIQRLAVVASEDGSHDLSVSKASKSGLDVAVVEE